MKAHRHYDHRRPRYSKFVSEQTGLTNTVKLSGVSSRGLYALNQWYANPANVEHYSNDRVSHEIQAAGKSKDLQKAFDTTIGEYVERYCLRFPEQNLGGHEIFKATYDEVASKGEVIDYGYLDIYRSEDHEGIFPEPFTRDTELLWTSGTNLVTGEEVYTPAELVWFRSGVIAEHPARFPCTTSGVAAGPTMEFALLAGIHELVERDSIMDLWLRQRVPPTIDKESLADHWPEVYEFVTDVEMGHAHMHLFDFEPEVDIPTIGGVASHEDGKFPNFMHGSGTDINLKDAVEQAATEGTQGWPFILSLIIEYGIEGFDAAAQDDNFEQNVLHYALPGNSDEIEFYYEGETVRIDEQYSLDRHQNLDDWSIRDQLRLAVDRLVEAGWTPIIYDLTTRDALEAGIRVTRVRCPEAVPLTPQSVPPVEHPRYDGTDDLCTKPHPSP